MGPQHRRIGEIRLAWQRTVAGVFGRDVARGHFLECRFSLHQLSASFETRPGFAATLLRMRYIIDGIQELPHPEAPAQRASRRTHTVDPAPLQEYGVMTDYQIFEAGDVVLQSG